MWAVGRGPARPARPAPGSRQRQRAGRLQRAPHQTRPDPYPHRTRTVPHRTRTSGGCKLCCMYEWHSDPGLLYLRACGERRGGRMRRRPPFTASPPAWPARQPSRRPTHKQGQQAPVPVAGGHRRCAGGTFTAVTGGRPGARHAYMRGHMFTDHRETGSLGAHGPRPTAHDTAGVALRGVEVSRCVLRAGVRAACCVLRATWRMCAVRRVCPLRSFVRAGRQCACTLLRCCTPGGGARREDKMQST